MINNNNRIDMLHIMRNYVVDAYVLDVESIDVLVRDRCVSYPNE